MTASEQIRRKVERAKKHISELQIEWRKFAAGKPEPYVVSFRDDMETQERTYYLQSIRDVPIDFSTIIGDALQNLRSALDHLIQFLILKETGEGPTGTRICFPIGKDSTEYPPPYFGGHIKGLGNTAKEILGSIKPYKGGNETLWRLHSLNNRDKHRLLIPAVTSLTHHSITTGIRREVLKSYLGSYPNASIMPDLYQTFVKPDSPEFPLKQGSVLLTVPIAELENDMSFTFDVAFNEPDLVQGEIVIDVLRNMEWTVSNIIDRFERVKLL